MCNCSSWLLCETGFYSHPAERQRYRCLQEGNLHNPRSCATAFPCVVKQGLLFVKPQPHPKAPVTHSTAASSSSSRQEFSSSSSSSSGADPYADVPTIPELDQEGWVSQVGDASACGRHPGRVWTWALHAASTVWCWA